MKILVTGAAGFIGAALTEALLDRGDLIAGVDNHSDYYEPKLKDARLSKFLGHNNYTHFRSDISCKQEIEQVFDRFKPDRVVNLAAQAGVRYSLENPSAYIDSNIIGFANILEACRTSKVEHLVYASSSSVYGANERYPFSVKQNVDHPISLYAATKKSNELMAHAYSHLYGIPTTGLRFFTVYGPWGRPDMALFKFTKSIIAGEPIQLYSSGKHQRDFTYIDDIVEGLMRVLDKPAQREPLWCGSSPIPDASSAPYRIYNIGNGKSVPLMRYVEAIERALGIAAVKEWLPPQMGDVPDTQADMSEFFADFNFLPRTDIEIGVPKFVEWYLNYTRG